jgi:hypothetical protein
MTRFGICGGFVGGLLGLVAVTLMTAIAGANAAQEETFDVLQIGTQTYRNVTVTAKAKDYIFILHSGGMANIKIAQLPSEVRERLGYQTPQSKPTVKGSDLGSKRLKVWQEGIAQRWRAIATQRSVGALPVGPAVIFCVLGALALGYIFFCYCCLLICRKTGNSPGVLIWLPVLQLFPLLRAAKMSSWWFLAYLVPVLNILAHVLWTVKIVQARGKSVWLAVLLLLPITGFFAFLYLAFSDRVSPKKERVVEIMTLDAA